MRILVVNTQVPFVRGGAEMQAEELVRRLREIGHDAETVSIPFQWMPPDRVPDHMLVCRMLDLTQSCGERIDRVIALKFPAYLVSHPNKILWLAHQHRAAYDGWLAGTSELLHHPAGLQVRETIQAADRNVLGEARKIYTVSHVVTERLQTFCGFGSEVLYHPPPYAERFRCETPDDYVLMPGRVTGSKRHSLVLAALERTKQPVRLRIIGAAEGPAATERFRAQLLASPAADRVVWDGLVSEVDKIEAYARCRGVIFPPINEDYGYVTLEAMLAAKPVITCRDSGGPLEFVDPGVTGLICEPERDDLADSLDRLWSDPARAIAFGKAGRAVYEAKRISWERPLACLTA